MKPFRKDLEIDLGKFPTYPCPSLNFGCRWRPVSGVQCVLCLVCHVSCPMSRIPHPVPRVPSPTMSYRVPCSMSSLVPCPSSCGRRIVLYSCRPKHSHLAWCGCAGPPGPGTTTGSGRAYPVRGKGLSKDRVALAPSAGGWSILRRAGRLIFKLFSFRFYNYSEAKAVDP